MCVINMLQTSCIPFIARTFDYKTIRIISKMQIYDFALARPNKTLHHQELLIAISDQFLLIHFMQVLDLLRNTNYV